MIYWSLIGWHIWYWSLIGWQWRRDCWDQAGWGTLSLETGVWSSSPHCGTLTRWTHVLIETESLSSSYRSCRVENVFTKGNIVNIYLLATGISKSCLYHDQLIYHQEFMCSELLPQHYLDTGSRSDQLSNIHDSQGANIMLMLRQRLHILLINIIVCRQKCLFNVDHSISYLCNR